MGYRAQVVTQHREYGASVFHDWTAFQSYLRFLKDEYEGELADDIYENDEENFYEIPKEIIKKEIERLEKMDPEVQVEELEWESKYVLASLRACLEESPEDNEYVALEWY